MAMLEEAAAWLAEMGVQQPCASPVRLPACAAGSSADSERGEVRMGGVDGSAGGCTAGLEGEGAWPVLESWEWLTVAVYTCAASCHESIEEGAVFVEEEALIAVEQT